MNFGQLPRIIRIVALHENKFYGEVIFCNLPAKLQCVKLWESCIDRICDEHGNNVEDERIILIKE